MQDRLLLGSRLVLLCAILLLVGSAVATLTYCLTQGTDRLPQQLVRFWLTAVLAWKLYSGSVWARRLTLFFIGIATFSLASLMLEMETFDPLGLLLLVFYALVIGILMFGPGVRQYFTTPVQTGKSRHMNG